MGSLRDNTPNRRTGTGTRPERNSNTMRRTQPRPSGIHSYIQTGSKKETGRAPKIRGKPRITGRKNGPVWTAIVLWKLRTFKNKVFYIGYKLYPVLMFITAFLLGMLLPTYIWGVVFPINMAILNASFLMVALLLIYYTYRWLAWKRSVKLYYKRYYASLKKNGTGRRPVRRVVASSGKRRR